MQRVCIRLGFLSILTCLTLMVALLATKPVAAEPVTQGQVGPFDPVISLLSQDRVVIDAKGCTVVTITGRFFYPNATAKVIAFDLKHSKVRPKPRLITIDALGRAPATDVTFCGLPKRLINKIYINLEDQQTSFNSNTLIINAR